MNAPLYLARSGDVNGGVLYGPGSYGLYWSSTVYSSGNARNLFFYATGVFPEYNDARFYGFSVRCVTATLNILYNSNLTNDATGLMNAPLYLARSGYVDGGTLYYPGSNGVYWSSTVNSSDNARYLFFYATSVGLESADSRYNGFSVRWVV